MKGTEVKDDVKTYIKQLDKIIKSNGLAKSKIDEICDLKLPANNANAVLIYQKALEARQPARSPKEFADIPGIVEDLTEVRALNKVKRIEMMLKDLKAMNYYGFGYELEAYYISDSPNLRQNRRLVWHKEVSDQPTIAKSCKVVNKWAKEIPQSFKEGKLAFSLARIDSGCVCFDSGGNCVSYVRGETVAI
jgi:hypothetical protein